MGRRVVIDMRHLDDGELAGRQLVLTEAGVTAEAWSGPGWVASAMTDADRQAMLDARDLIESALAATKPTFSDRLGL